MAQVKTFRGIKFPFQKSPQGTPAPSTNDQTIRDSIVQILMTSKGERVMRPSFGTKSLRYLFSTQSPDLNQTVQAEITKALVANEPRAEIVSLRVTPVTSDNSKILAGIRVQVGFRSKLTGEGGLVDVSLV